MSKRSLSRAALATLVVLTAIGGALFAWSRSTDSPLPANLRGVVVAAPMKLGAVHLTDHRGGTVTDAWFAGHWTFLFFGFTSCSDVCPATLAQLAVLKKVISRNHPDVSMPRYVFVSVDPERDTRTRLKTYLANFDPSFVGMSGDPAQIEALERPMGAFHRKGKPAASGYYSVSHSAEIFLLDPSARVYARFIPPLKPAVVADQLRAIVTLYAHNTRPDAAPSG